MPSINGTEYLVILVIALLVFGPQRLPELIRKLGGYLREVRSVANDFRNALEAEVGDLKDVRDSLTELKEEAKGVTHETLGAMEWKGPIHDSGPTPADASEDLRAIEEGEPPIQDARSAETEGPFVDPGPADEAEE